MICKLHGENFKRKESLAVLVWVSLCNLRTCIVVYHVTTLYKGHISHISSLSLKLYLNSLVYHQTSSGYPEKFFIGNLRQSLENVRQGDLQSSFGESLKSSQKSPENINIMTRTLHVSSNIKILYFHGNNNISLVHCTYLWDIVIATLT